MTAPGVQQARRAWLRGLAAARTAAAAPQDDHAAVALKQALRRLDVASFPLEAGDVRLRLVRVFLDLQRTWVMSGGGTRTAFAATLAAAAADLDRILAAQGADLAQAHMQRQGLG